jgi:dethiobiotin synthetase
VGKTVVAAALAAWCRAQGLDVGVMKPVATGGRWLRGANRWVSEDAIDLVAAAGTDDPWPLVNPVCLREPLAPWTAALRSRRPIESDLILEAFERLRARHEVLVVEGIGGLLVPLGARLTVAALARRLGLPILLVARPGLGTLNHTLLSLRCARTLGLRVAGVVINQAAPAPRGRMARLAEETNPAILERLAGVPILGPLPFRTALRNGARRPSSLLAWLVSSLGPRGLTALARYVKVSRVSQPRNETGGAVACRK